MKPSGLSSTISIIKCSPPYLCTSRQVALADIILVNKTDLVSQQQLETIKGRIRYVHTMNTCTVCISVPVKCVCLYRVIYVFLCTCSCINSMAKMVETLRSRIELDLILDLHAYDSTSRSIPNTPSSHSNDGAHISNVSPLSFIEMRINSLCFYHRLCIQWHSS